MFCKYSEDELKMNCVVKVFRGKANVLTSAEIFFIIFFLFLRTRQKQTVIEKKQAFISTLLKRKIPKWFLTLGFLYTAFTVCGS